jgi:Arm DNA-binding domain
MARLTDFAIKKTTEGLYVDGDGLQLVVSASGRRKWVMRYQLSGVRRDMGLGPYPTIGLSQARILAADARNLMAGGIDPLEARQATRKAEKPIPTFGDIAKLVIVDAQQKSSNAKVRYQWEHHLGDAYSGKLLARPVNEIATLEIAAVLRPVGEKKPEVARKLYPAVRRVFDHARIILRHDHGIFMPDNPARWSDLKAIGFGPPTRLTRGSHPSLPRLGIANVTSGDYDEAPKFGRQAWKCPLRAR